MKTKFTVILLAAIIVFAAFAGCTAQPDTPASPTPDTTQPTASPTPEPIWDENFDPELWSDTEVFGYVSSIAEDSIVVAIKGEDITYIASDKARFAKEISVLGIGVGDYVLVAFSVEDGTHYLQSLGKTMPPGDETADPEEDIPTEADSVKDE